MDTGGQGLLHATAECFKLDGQCQVYMALPEWALTELPKQKSISCSVLSKSLGPQRL